jgi:hypothetical protein
VKRENAVGKLPGRAVPAESQHRQLNTGSTLECQAQFKRHQGIKTRFDKLLVWVYRCHRQS